MSNKHQSVRFGLRAATIDKICTVLAKHQRIEKAVIYGSRAKGNYKPGSDIDLTLYGQNLTRDDLATVMDELDDLLLPYSIDLSLFDELNHAKLREHIERVGLVFYERGDAGGVMKAGWQMKRLGEICLIQPPKSEARKNLKNSDLVSFVPMESMGIDQKYFDTSKVRALEEVAGSYTYFADGDVLLAKITPCFENGKLGIAQNLKNGVGFGSSEYIVFRGAESLHNQFLYYFLSRKTFREEGAKRMAGAVGHKRVTKEFIENTLIPLPPLPEQQRIVAILDEAFEGIATATANAKKNLLNARELFESTVQSAFANKGEGWLDKTIKEITSLLGDGLHGTPKYTDGGEYYFVNGNNLDDGKIVFKESTKRVSATEYEKHKKNLTERTILVSINGTLGNVAFYNNEKIILGKSACYFNLLDGVDKHFIKYIISSPYFLQYSHREATGATIKNVSLKSMREFKVPLPSLTEQNTIVAKLDELSTETKKLEAIYQQKLVALDELKKSVLNQAFAGEL